MKPTHIVMVRELIVDAISQCNEVIVACSDKHLVLARQLDRERKAMAKQRIEKSVMENLAIANEAILRREECATALDDFDLTFELKSTAVGPLPPGFPPGVRMTEYNVGGFTDVDVYNLIMQHTAGC